MAPGCKIGYGSRPLPPGESIFATNYGLGDAIGEKLGKVPFLRQQATFFPNLVSIVV